METMTDYNKEYKEYTIDNRKNHIRQHGINYNNQQAQIIVEMLVGIYKIGCKKQDIVDCSKNDGRNYKNYYNNLYTMDYSKIRVEIYYLLYHIVSKIIQIIVKMIIGIYKNGYSRQDATNYSTVIVSYYGRGYSKQDTMDYSRDYITQNVM